jgi:UDPglucose--hexose-1-phosphate uridylyltransferase
VRGEQIDLVAAEAAGTRVLPAVGATEVVLFSPDHHQSLATLGDAQVRKVIDLWAARTDALLARQDVEYVLVFENRGREVGATIDHPHGQIYGYPYVPPAPAREAAVAREHGCSVCAELKQELSDGTRIVAEHGDWVAWVPYASGYAYGMRFAPRTHVGTLPALDDALRDDLAALLADALGRYDRLWPPPHRGYLFPYLLWFHQAPASGGDEWHVHAHVAPPLRAPGVQRYVASGELGSGTLSNPVVPEAAARALREA